MQYGYGCSAKCSYCLCMCGKWVLGPTVFQRKFCHILRASSRNSTAHRGKIVQIPRLTTVSHLWLKTERAVQKLQLLKAGIVLKVDTHLPSVGQCVTALSYVSTIKRKSLSFFSKVQWNSWLMMWVTWNEWLMSQSSLITPTIILVNGHFSDSAEMLKFNGKRQIPLPVENCEPHN